MASMTSAHRVPALSGKAIIRVGVGLIAYHEVFCDEGELISDEVDRKRVKNPILIPLIIIVTAAHLLRRLPTQLDPFAWLGILRVKGNK